MVSGKSLRLVEGGPILACEFEYFVSESTSVGIDRGQAGQKDADP